MALVYFFENLFSVLFNRRQLDEALLHSLCRYMLLWLKYIEKSVLTLIRSWKRKAYFHHLFRKLWLFFFDTTPKLNTRSFLRSEL